MTHCDITPDAAERYVAGTMVEPERTGFEDHFFACDACFRTVQTLEDAREVLMADGSGTAAAPPAPGRGLPLRWMAIAATVALSMMVWRVSRPTEPLPETVITSEAPPAGPQPIAPALPAEMPAPAPPLDPVRVPARPSTQSRLERWAAVIPPKYVALTTRSGQSDEDKDARAFDEAMAHYSAGRYRQAADGLQTLADGAPAAAHIQFFLGISELMSGNVTRARGALQRSAESGVSPYSDEAHFYLAKTALRAGDLTTATRELQLAVEREAGPEGDAKRLLAEVRRAGG